MDITLPSFLSDALEDSLKLVLPLFIIFIFIEFFEKKFMEKISYFLDFSKHFGPLIGAFFAIIPQCGFSVIATVLYLKKFLSPGTLIAIYIATSDEAIPILINYPEMFSSLLKIILIKFVFAIIVGYFVDFILNKEDLKKCEEEIGESGCCKHEISSKNKKFSLIHPLKHTFNLFIFILAICIFLNYLTDKIGFETLSALLLNNSFVQPILTAFIGLIPNCAISVLISMLYVKNIISLPSVISGLSAGGGLGVLVLFKKTSDIKNSFLILLILLISSILLGILLYLLHF